MEAKSGASTSQVPRLWPFLLICAAAALWIDLGSLHRQQHADSLIPVMVSLQRWTPYFWEQDRYGMLIPWLARPLTHPFANLLVQGFLNVSCGLSAFFLLARYMLKEPTYPLVGALGAAAFLILAPAPYRFDYLMDANYGPWLALGPGGLLVAEGGEGRPGWGRRLVALALLVLTHWVYSASALYLGTLVVSRALFASPRALSGLRPASITSDHLKGLAAGFARSGPGRQLLLIAAGFSAGMALSQLAQFHPTSFASLPLASWPSAWAALVARTWEALAPGAWPMALGLSAGVVVLACLVRGGDRRSSIPWRPSAALAVTALVVALFMGTRHWLKINKFSPRYLLPSAMLLQAALAMLIVVPLSGALDARRRRWMPAAAALLLLMGAAAGYGLPSPGRVRADLDRFGGLTKDLLDARCTHLAGNYWTVWPAVFHANLVLHERGEHRTVWGVTFRAQPASVLWWTTPLDRRIVCIPLRDPYGDNWLMAFGMPWFRDVERRATVRVLRWRKPTSDAAQAQ